MGQQGSVQLKISSPTKLAVLSDLHLPFADPAATVLALKVLEAFPPDVIVINGDVVDFHGISRFIRLPDRRAGFRREIEVDRALLSTLLSQFGSIPIYWLEGNHEYRLESYLMTRSPELYGLDSLKIEQLLGVADRVTYIRRVPFPVSRQEKVAPELQAGQLVISHGDMFRAGPYTIQIARNLFLKLQAQGLVGHWHRNDAWEQTAYDGSVRGFWVVGCLCYPRPEYDAGRHWGQGLALVDLYPNGLFRVDLVRMVPDDRHLTAIVGGRQFSARLRGVLGQGLEEVWTLGRVPRLF